MSGKNTESRKRQYLKVLLGLIIGVGLVAGLIIVNANSREVKYNHLMEEAVGYKLNGDNKSAIDLYDKAVEAAQGSQKHDALTERGKLYSKEGDYSSAIADFESALKLLGDNHPNRQSIEDELKHAKQGKEEQAFSE
jgi:tetratricopeptide (TPR) repeat protein